MNYRVNKNTDNPKRNNEVHNEHCQYYNKLVSYESLSNHSNCQSAVSTAKLMGYDADGCIVCSSACHTE